MKNLKSAIKTPKVLLKNIPENGHDYEWTEQDPWVASLFKNDLPDFYFPGQKVTFKCHLQPDGKNFQLQGEFNVKLQALCDRCGKEFGRELHETFDLLLIPPAAQGRWANAKKELAREDADSEWGSSEDPEDVGEDLESSILKSEDVDLSVYFKEQVLLNQPMTARCRADCPGLCLRCGADLSLGPCQCDPKTPPSGSPFAALSKLKLK